MSKHFKRDEQRQDDEPPPKYGDPLPPQRWSSETPVEDTWKHKAKSSELRTLVARCLRAEPPLFVREDSDNAYTITLRDRNVIPRQHFLDNATFDECMLFLDTYQETTPAVTTVGT
jgi:hypothetical protein